LKNAKHKKIKYAVEKEKNKMAYFWRGRKLKKCKWWKKGRKIKYEITASFLPARASHFKTISIP
jgi:hypothetical protein